MIIDNSNINFQLATDFINYTNRSIFLTGKAGTGKTTFLKYIRENCNKQSVVVAPTGVAAINANGVTIHSFFQLPFSPFIPRKKDFSLTNELTIDKNQLLAKVKLNKEKIDIIKNLELLIIDEISMVRCDVLDALDQILRHYRNKHHKPFGDLQVLLIGDMFQLPPVVAKDEWQLLSPYYNSPYFFDSLVIKEDEPACIELNKIYRQDDEVFIGLLNKIRNNHLDEDDLGLLNHYYNPNFQTNKKDGYITLTTHNARADAINAEALNSIENPSYFFKAVIENNFSEKIFPIDEVLELKLGSQVMFTKNDTEKNKKYFNGKIGTIVEINNEEIFVKCNEEEDLIKVVKYTWQNINYTINTQKQLIEEEVIGTFTQYPLKLAWAITIHKSQGLTFDKAIIDAGKAFAPGQVYVALSRCRSLKHVVLVSKINSSSLFTDAHINEFSKNFKNKQLAENLEFEKNLHQIKILSLLFSFDDEQNNINKLKDYLLENQSVFNAASENFIEDLKKQIDFLFDVGLKFTKQLLALNNNNILPEFNDSLQKRFKKAAIYFCKALTDLINSINKSPIITDNKALAKTITDLLKQIFITTQLKHHLLSELENGFNYSNYLTRKKEFTVATFNINAYSNKSNNAYQYSKHPKLYNTLTDLRDEICEETGEPVYMILSSKSLEEMATYLPLNKTELLQISGFGQTKIKKYGHQFLEIIINYCSQNKLSSLIHTKEKRKIIKEEKDKIKKNKVDTKEVSYNLFREGNSVDEIAKERNFTPQTIEGHLCKYISNGKIVITELITPEKASTIIKSLEKVDKVMSITQIKTELGDAFSYGELKMVMAHVDFVNSKSTVNE